MGAGEALDEMVVDANYASYLDYLDWVPKVDVLIQVVWEEGPCRFLMDEVRVWMLPI